MPAVRPRAAGRLRHRRVGGEAALVERARRAVRLLVQRDHLSARRGQAAAASRRRRRRPSADRPVPRRHLAQRSLRPGLRRPVVRRPDGRAVARARRADAGARSRAAGVRGRDSPRVARRAALPGALGAGEAAEDQGPRLRLHRLAGHVQPRRPALDRRPRVQERPADDRRGDPPRDRRVRRDRRTVRRHAPGAAAAGRRAERGADRGRGHGMARSLAQGRPQRHRDEAARALLRPRRPGVAGRRRRGRRSTSR